MRQFTSHRQSFAAWLRQRLKAHVSAMGWLRISTQRLMRTFPNLQQHCLRVVFWVDAVSRVPETKYDAKLSNSRMHVITDTSDYTQLALYYFGTAQRSMESLVARLPLEGGIVVDVGANVGEFTLRVVERFQKHKDSSYKVIAFEPNPVICEILRVQVLRNNLDDTVEIYNAALSKREGRSSFVIEDPSKNSARGHLATPHEMSNDFTNQHSFYVDVKTLDNVLATRELKVHIVKVDVEGAELFVLQGAQNILREDRPVLILEAVDAYMHTFNYSYAELIEFLIAHNYKIRTISDTGSWFIESALVHNDPHEQRDIICFPEELFDNRLQG